ncbi:MAG: DUF1838 family protein [Pseudomonadota bacterium]
MTNVQTWSRRQVGAGLILGAAATPLSKLSAAAGDPMAAAPILDVQDPQVNLESLMKLVGDTSGKPVVGWYSGHVFGVRPDEKVQPLFGVEGFGVGRFERQEDGSFRQIWREVGAYRDIETGEIMSRWKNPYTGETNQIMDIQNGAINQVWRNKTPQLPDIPDLDFTFGNYGHADDMVLPWMIDTAGDYASIMYDVIGRRRSQLDPEVWKRESPGPFARVMECYQYGSKLSYIADPELTSAPYAGAWQRLADWLPWMLMDQAPGHLFYRAGTRKLRSVEDLPADLLAYAKANYPTFLEAPTEWKMETESSFDVYQRLRKPAPPRA